MLLKYRNIERFKYELAEEYRHQTPIKGACASSPFIGLDDDGMLTIRPGYKWDGASGPTIDSGCSMRGALVHDALYELMRRGVLEQAYREAADRLLRDICIEDGMSEVRASLWFNSVRVAAGGCARPGSQPSDEILTAGKE